MLLYLKSLSIFFTAYFLPIPTFVTNFIKYIFIAAAIWKQHSAAQMQLVNGDPGQLEALDCDDVRQRSLLY